jgi:hypothetical protein
MVALAGSLAGTGLALFNFVIDAIIKECLDDTTDRGVHVLPGYKLPHLDYADDIVLLFNSVQAAQSTRYRLSKVVPSFGWALPLRILSCQGSH